MISRTECYLSIFILTELLNSRLFLASIQEDRFVETYLNYPLSSGKWECVREIALSHDGILKLREIAHAAHTRAFPHLDGQFTVDSAIFGSAILVFHWHRPIRIDVLQYVTQFIPYFITKGLREESSVFYLEKIDAEGTIFRLGLHVTDVVPRFLLGSVPMTVPVAMPADILVATPATVPVATPAARSVARSVALPVALPVSMSHEEFSHLPADIVATGIPALMDQDELSNADLESQPRTLSGNVSPNELVGLGPEDGIALWDVDAEPIPDWEELPNLLQSLHEMPQETPIADTLNNVKAPQGLDQVEDVRQKRTPSVEEPVPSGVEAGSVDAAEGREIGSPGTKKARVTNEPVNTAQVEIRELQTGGRIEERGVAENVSRPAEPVRSPTENPLVLNRDRMVTEVAMGDEGG